MENLQSFHTWQMAESQATQVPEQSGTDALNVGQNVQELTDSVDMCHYNLRPRIHPIVTTDWSTTQWTNEFHTKR